MATRKDFTPYKYMNAGSGCYKKHINEKDLGTSCWIWLGIIIVVGLVMLAQ